MTKLIRVYGWRNIHTDEWYIGQTSLPMKKRACRGNSYKHSTAFYEAIQKYGWDSFEENILRLCTTREEANYWEKFFISEKDSIKHGYNRQGGGFTGYEVLPECKEKIRKANYGRVFSDEARHHMSESHKGNHLSEETKKKLSEANKGKPSFWKGKTLSEETKRKMSEVRKGRKLSELHAQHISQGQRNCPSKSKRVCQYTKDNQFVAEYPSIAEASRQIGVPYSNISACCRGYGRVKSAGGYIWRYA